MASQLFSINDDIQEYHSNALLSLPFTILLFISSGKSQCHRRSLADRIRGSADS